MNEETNDTMGFFDGVKECNDRNGGRHRWGEPKEMKRFDGGKDYKQTCNDCGVSSWGKSKNEVQGRSQEFDKAQRRGWF